MSVCFFVPADNNATVVEETEQESAEEVVQTDNSQQTLQQFWSNVMDDVKKVNADDFKTQALPLARIKKIMKLDEEVKMISAEAPVMFAKAAEIFIHELTLRAWQHTEDNKRRTLQRNDIAMAISKSDQFDFLIDIVPRHEVKPHAHTHTHSHSHTHTHTHTHKPREEMHTSAPAPAQAQAPRNEQYCVQLSGQSAAAVSHPHTQFVIQPTQPTATAAILQQQTSNAQAASSANASNVQVQQPVTIVQQLVTSGGEVQQVPIQLTAAQLNMIRLQVQNNPGQPIVIQAQHAAQPQPQIIQVTSQGQPQQQVYLAQVGTAQAQDDS